MTHKWLILNRANESPIQSTQFYTLLNQNFWWRRGQWEFWIWVNISEIFLSDQVLRSENGHKIRFIRTFYSESAWLSHRFQLVLPQTFTSGLHGRKETRKLWEDNRQIYSQHFCWHCCRVRITSIMKASIAMTKTPRYYRILLTVGFGGLPLRYKL